MRPGFAERQKGYEQRWERQQYQKAYYEALLAARELELRSGASKGGY